MAFLVVSLACFLAVCAASLRVETPLGTVKGVLDLSVDIPVECFRGIPFGLPPVGERRFALPEPFGHFGDLDGRNFRPACVQSVKEEVTTNSSEDCLHLNVFRRPSIPKGSPVIVIIHGGEFVFGSAQDVYYNGVPLAAFGETVVVSLQYRLGILGFGHTRQSASNVGMHDQLLALKWIHDYISYFGGDPNQITLLGTNAGSMSIIGLISSVEVRGKNLFQSAIMDSRVMSMTARPQETIRRIERVAYKLNCPTTDNEMLDCLRAVKVDDLIKASFIPEDEKRKTTFMPTFDGNFFPENFETSVEKFDKIRLIIGTAKDEVESLEKELKPFKDAPLIDCLKHFSKQLQFELNFDESSEKTFEQIYRNLGKTEAVRKFVADGSFHCPVNYFVEQYSRHVNDIFVFRFDRKLARPYVGGLDPAKGAFHFSPYLHFSGGLLLFGPFVDPRDQTFFQDSIATISNFAKGNQPSFRGKDWPSFSKRGEIFVFDETPSIESKFVDGNDCAVFPFWRWEPPRRREEL